VCLTLHVKTQAAIKHFGSQSAISEALKLTRSAVCQWGDVVPYWSARKIERLTEGVVKVEAALYDEDGRPRSKQRQAA